MRLLLKGSLKNCVAAISATFGLKPHRLAPVICFVESMFGLTTIFVPQTADRKHRNSDKNRYAVPHKGV